MAAKLKKIIFIILPMLFIGGAVLAQEMCKVSLTSIAGDYEGGCKKGKADGEGKSSGEDEYIGTFKDGLPHGFGKYFWKKGGSYEGEWVKGKMEGQGKQIVSSKDSGKKTFM